MIQTLILLSTVILIILNFTIMYIVVKITNKVPDRIDLVFLLDNSHTAIHEILNAYVKSLDSVIVRLNKLYTTIKNTLVNHTNLQEKLQVEVENIHYRGDSVKDAEFRVAMRGIVKLVSTTYKTLRIRSEKDLNPKLKVVLLKAIEDYLISTKTFTTNNIINVKYLSKIYFIEFNSKKATSDNMDLITDLFSRVLTATYEDFLNSYSGTDSNTSYTIKEVETLVAANKRTLAIAALKVRFRNDKTNLNHILLLEAELSSITRIEASHTASDSDIALRFAKLSSSILTFNINSNEN